MRVNISTEMLVEVFILQSNCSEEIHGDETYDLCTADKIVKKKSMMRKMGEDDII